MPSKVAFIFGASNVDVNEMTLDAPERNATFKGEFREEDIKLRISHFCVIAHDSAIIFALRGHLLKFPVSREQTRGSPSAIQPFNMRFPTARPARSAQVSRLAATAPGAARAPRPPSINDVTRGGDGGATEGGRA